MREEVRELDKRKRHDMEKKYSSDVNIWLVSDQGIITSDQHCQFLCRMP